MFALIPRAWVAEVIIFVIQSLFAAAIVFVSFAVMALLINVWMCMTGQVMCIPFSVS